MRKIALLLFFITNFCFSQIIKGTLISSEDNSSIQYAKIGFENIEKGNFSDENGNFTLDLTNIDRKSVVKIEVAGFQTYQISVEKILQINPISIALNPRINEIEEVVISSKNYTSKNLGYNSKSKKLHIDYLPKNSKVLEKRYTKEELEKPQMEIAVPIQSKNKSKITRININFAKFDVGKPMPARFIIYKDLEGKPDKILNEEDLLFELSNANLKDDTFTLDVTDKNIWFSGKIFVSFQPLDRNFSGSFWISAGILGNAYARSFVEKWKKLPASFVPAINIDVKMEN